MTMTMSPDCSRDVRPCLDLDVRGKTFALVLALKPQTLCISPIMTFVSLKITAQASDGRSRQFDLGIALNPKISVLGLDLETQGLGFGLGTQVSGLAIQGLGFAILGLAVSDLDFGLVPWPLRPCWQKWVAHTVRDRTNLPSRKSVALIKCIVYYKSSLQGATVQP